MNVGHMMAYLAAAATPLHCSRITDEGSVLERKASPRLELQLDRFNEVVAEVIVDFVGDPKIFRD